jgi:phosphoribosylaminoimidazolecarboxamide formyltransferase/IMP cyclohydrolase
MIVVHPSTAAAAAAEVRISRALLSVHDKRGLEALGRGLVARGIELVATGGTAAALAAAGLPVVLVESLTGYPELLEGRVKSLHPAIHAGILFQRHLPAHQAAVAAHGIRPIDLVIASLYPFAAARARGAGLAELVEHIDVGGPAMVRAAAKNFAHVGVVVGPEQYDRVLAELEARRGALGPALRFALAAEAFAALAAYDAAVAQALAELGPAAGAAPPPAAPAEAPAPDLPAVLVNVLPRARALRYGENPHQRAAFYADPAAGGFGAALVHQGKEISYNNLLDLDAALALVSEFPAGGCVVVKHASPSGVAVGRSPGAAFRLARDTDPLSAFGGVIGFAERVDEEAAAEIVRDFYEVVVAPGYTPEAREKLASKPALRVVEVPPAALARARGALQLRSAAGGLLVQEPDLAPDPGPLEGTVVTQRAPTDSELAALGFAVRVAKHARSNAIVFAREGHTIAIGAGQASRIDAVEVAAMKAARTGHDLRGTVLASDAFFPFADAVERAGALGVTAIAEPGGSRRDAESIAAADRWQIALLFTGERHFAH